MLRIARAKDSIGTLSLARLDKLRNQLLARYLTTRQSQPRAIYFADVLNDSGLALRGARSGEHGYRCLQNNLDIHPQ